MGLWKTHAIELAPKPVEEPVEQVAEATRPEGTEVRVDRLGGGWFNITRGDEFYRVRGQRERDKKLAELAGS